MTEIHSLVFDPGVVHRPNVTSLPPRIPAHSVLAIGKFLNSALQSHFPKHKIIVERSARIIAGAIPQSKRFRRKYGGSLRIGSQT